MSTLASINIAPKHSFKRRKISSSTDEELSAKTNFSVSMFDGQPNTQLNLKASSHMHTPAGKLVCVSCQRAITIRSDAVISCARCGSTLHAICSRMCTAPPPSMPPTPLLTYSPTPASTPAESPRRTALGLASINGERFIAGGNGNKVIGKRRKFDLVDNGGVKREDEARNTEENDVVMKGCGRTVCKECCEENWQSGSTTCKDCYERI